MQISVELLCVASNKVTTHFVATDFVLGSEGQFA